MEVEYSWRNRRGCMKAAQWCTRVWKGATCLLSGIHVSIALFRRAKYTQNGTKAFHYTFPIWRRRVIEMKWYVTSVKAFLSATLALCKRRITFLAPSTTAASIRKRCRSSSTLSSNANSKLGSYLSVIRKLSIMLFIRIYILNEYYVTILLYSHGRVGWQCFILARTIFLCGGGGNENWKYAKV